jgi:hypothetical protein
MDNEMLIKTTERHSSFSNDHINLKDVLSLRLYKILEEMEKKILTGRIKNPDAEKIRLEYIKAYINGCNCFKSITDNQNATTIYDTDRIREYLETSQEMADIEPEMDNPAVIQIVEKE